MEDQTDAFGFSIFKKKDKDGNNDAVKEVSAIDLKSDCYDMNHYRRGTAVIFNHYKYDERLRLERRDGTLKDANDLRDVLQDIRFDVVVYKDLNFGTIYNKLMELSKADYSNDDCLLIAVLSHGDTGKVYAYDNHYPPEMLWELFAGDQCPTLAGKPKLFFIQACRGDQVDDGVKVRAVQADAKNVNVTIPVMADILVMYSCFDGYLSWRSTATGSWFIQCLCKELKTRSRKDDLVAILTFLNRRMAFYYKSFKPEKKKMHGKKQIGTVVSTLTRLLYFYPVDS